MELTDVETMVGTNLGNPGNDMLGDQFVDFRGHKRVGGDDQSVFPAGRSRGIGISRHELQDWEQNGELLGGKYSAVVIQPDTERADDIDFAPLPAFRVGNIWVVDGGGEILILRLPGEGAGMLLSGRWSRNGSPSRFY